MKDCGDIRRVGRGQRDARVLRSHHSRLQERWIEDGGAMLTTADRKAIAAAARQARVENNWRVKQLSPTLVLALEPGREYENLFEGGDDPYWEAVTHAAAELRKSCDEQ